MGTPSSIIATFTLETVIGAAAVVIGLVILHIDPATPVIDLVILPTAQATPLPVQVIQAIVPVRQVTFAHQPLLLELDRRILLRVLP